MEVTCAGGGATAADTSGEARICHSTVAFIEFSSIPLTVVLSSVSSVWSTLDLTVANALGVAFPAMPSMAGAARRED